MWERLKFFVDTCRKAFSLLNQAEPLILSSSTAFFATFSISPILIILVNLFSLYFKSETVANKLFKEVESTVGAETTKEIKTIVTNFMQLEGKGIISIASLIFFVFVGTTLLKVIKQNIHKLWKIRKEKINVKYQLRERATLLGIILLSGVLFLLSTFIDYFLAASLNQLKSLGTYGGIIIQLLNILLSVLVITTWFTILFKLLPEAKVDWKVSFNGGLLTAILFNIGKFLLSKVLVHARIENIFGASASFALLLLFIFYCSFIIYFGAAFTHTYGDHVNRHINTKRFANEYEEKPVTNKA